MKRIIYLVFIASEIFLISCSRKSKLKNQPDPAVPVNVTTVNQRLLKYYDSYPAIIVSLKEVELRAEVSGNITGINFIEGRPVRKGQQLYEIDRRRYQAAYDQAMANLDIAQQNLERSQRDANRYIELNKQEAIARQRLDNALTDLQNAKSQVVAAAANLTRAKTDLNYSVITAPFDGTIGISGVRMGALVTPNQTLLNVISSDDPMGCDIVVDEKELGRFQLLEKTNNSPKDTTFRLVLADNSVYKFYGKIYIIDRNVDPHTGTIKIRLGFPNPERILKPGMNCNVEVLNEHSGLQLTIPSKAVIEQMSEYFVFRIDSMKAKQTKILPGNVIGPDVIVKKGLNAGDTIVVDGIQRLRDGAVVKTGR